MAATLYRIVARDPPTLDDFTSNQARSKQPRLPADLEVLRLWNGLSAYATEAQARRKALSAPYLGDYIAKLIIRDDSPIQRERTLPRSPGHHTIWGEPGAVLASVQRVVPVQQSK